MQLTMPRRHDLPHLLHKNNILRDDLHPRSNHYQRVGIEIRGVDELPRLGSSDRDTQYDSPLNSDGLLPRSSFLLLTSFIESMMRNMRLK